MLDALPMLSHHFLLCAELTDDIRPDLCAGFLASIEPLGTLYTGYLLTETLFNPRATRTLGPAQ